MAQESCQEQEIAKEQLKRLQYEIEYEIDGKNVLKSSLYRTFLRPTCLSIGAETDKRCNTVDTCGARTACCCGTVIDVLRAVRPAPAINTHTDIAPNQIAAGPSILAGVWLQAALVYIFCAVLTCGPKCRQGEKEHKKMKLFPYL